ncbi:MAG: DUF1343 domain-containing protein [Trueperaceae bacterium]|nr:DUF1343 domain-containing protein [Trueperaceae bacterium]
MTRPAFRLGIDVLLSDPLRWLPGPRVGLLANQASLTGDGRPTLDALHAAKGVDLRALLVFEHGWSGVETDATPVPDRVDARTGLPVHSLYGPRRTPDPGMLATLDAVVVDVQEVGVRCYTYAATVALLLEAAAEAGTTVVICDRPNVLGAYVAGPPLDPTLRSFLSYLPTPFQHALTLGELAAWFAATQGPAHAVPVVVPMTGWRRGDPPREPWIPPSPGLPTLEAALLYPGLVLLEGTNLSEGRGTALPFQLLGAPWLDAYPLAEAVNAMALPGLLARPLDFVPDAGPFAGRVLGGVHLHVLDRRAVRAFEAVTAVLGHLRDTHAAFAWVDAGDMPWRHDPEAGNPRHEPTQGPLVDGLTGSDAWRRTVVEDAGADRDTAPYAWSDAAHAFLHEVGPHLLYAPEPRAA